ncbi:unnamed protein product [Cercopithifilaria johnstoni]|uniref:Uncharacterized protein n=1 Tax=Cercopithifilaria johnstoni TaxID=2874296 RepID=A0A8J2M238_9BILA|nr:unnamed protein product [Cercopithifilaria johnstoni]
MDGWITVSERVCVYVSVCICACMCVCVCIYLLGRDMASTRRRQLGALDGAIEGPYSRWMSPKGWALVERKSYCCAVVAR